MVGHLQPGGEPLARGGRVDDGVHPEPRGGVGRLGLAVVAGLDGGEALGLLLVGHGLALALGGGGLDLEQRLRGRGPAHHRDAGRRPREDEPRVVRLAAHRVVAGAVRVAHDHGELGDDGVRDGADHLGAVLDDAAVLGARAHHEARHVLHEHEGDLLLVAVHHEPRGLVGGVGVDDAAGLELVGLGLLAGLGGDDGALVGDDADAPAVDAGVAAEEGLAVAGLVLGPRAGVDDAREQVAHVVRRVAGLGEHGEHLLRVEGRRHGRRAVEPDARALAEAAHEVADGGDGGLVVRHLVVGHARDVALRGGAAERLVVRHLAHGGADERRAREEDAARALDDERLVRHDGQVGAAGHARTHDGRDLRDALAGEHGVVAEDAPEVLLVGEDLVLHRQEDAGRIDEVDDGEVVFEGDLLGAEVLLGRHGKPRAGLDGGVVRDDYAQPALDAPEHDDDARRRAAADVLVHPVGRPQPDLQEVAAVAERGDALAGGHLAAAVLALDPLPAAAELDLLLARLQRSQRVLVVGDAGVVGGGDGAEVGLSGDGSGHGARG